MSTLHHESIIENIYEELMTELGAQADEWEMELIERFAIVILFPPRAWVPKFGIAIKHLDSPKHF